MEAKRRSSYALEVEIRRAAGALLRVLFGARPLVLRALAVLITWPTVALAGETWEFVDGDGVLHMGNVPDLDTPHGSQAPSVSANAVEEPPRAGRELRWINRTWALRYPAWDAASGAVPASVALAPATGAGAAPRLPRGFNDVKPYLHAAALSHSVDPALVYSVAAAESAFNTDAVSHKGALGLMQIMPATAARYGVTGYSLQTGRHNVLAPEVNARVGSRYLADLLRMFGGDTALAVAAYNAGEGAVSKYGNRVPPYPETQKYVERVMGFYRSFKQ